MVSSWFSNTARRRVRWTAIGLAVVTGGAAVLLLAAHLIIDTSFLQARLNQRLYRSTNGLYEAEVGDIDLSLFLQSLEAENIKVRPDSAELERLHGTDSLPRARFAVELPSVSINDIGYWILLRRGGLQLDSLVVRRPEMTITTSAERESARQDSAAQSLTTRIQEVLPFVDMERLAVREGMLSLEGRRSARVEGLTLTLDDLHIDSTAVQDTSRVLFSRGLNLSIDAYERGLIDSLYSFKVRSVRGTSRDRSMRISSITVEPTLPDSIFVRRLPERDPRYDVDIGPVEMDAVDFRALAERQAVDIGTVTLDSMLFDLYLDRRVPKVPEPPPPMPQDIIQSINVPLNIDTLKIREGNIRYTLDLESTPREAQLTFDLLPSEITNISNDPKKMSPARPAVIKAGALINGTGPLYVRMRIPLLTPDLSMQFSGAMSQLDLKALNKVLFPMRRVKITGGAVDTLWFHGNVERGVAAGEFHAVYRDLTLEVANQADGGQNLPDNIKTFILNRALLKKSNPPSDGDSLRAGTIEHRHVRENSFFKFLWKSLQTGIYSLIGL